MLRVAEQQEATPPASPIDLTDWQIRGGIDIDFESGTQLGAGGTMVGVSFNPVAPEIRPSAELAAVVRISLGAALRPSGSQ